MERFAAPAAPRRRAALGAAPARPAGTGVMYTGLGGYELSGPFEFASFGGAGIELFLTDQLAMSFSWRIRHISNAGIEQPNPGLNTQFVMLGFDWFPKR